MKVGSITHNRNLSVESKGSKEKANFSDSFNLARRAKTKEELELQMTEIKKTGEKLIATKCYGDVIQYKKLIKDYLKSVVDYIYDINKNTSFWDRNYFTTVKTINEKLENMTRDLIYEEKDNMDHSNHHGILFPWLAIPSAEIHPGDGRHEKGAVRRVGQPRLVPGFTQSGTQRDPALS